MKTDKALAAIGLMQIIGFVLLLASAVSHVGPEVLVLICICGLAGFVKPILFASQRNALTIVASIAGAGIVIFTILRLVQQ